MTEEEQNIADAHHEAGHAVACFIFNIPITEVSIEEDPEHPGRKKGVTHDTSYGFDEKNYCSDWKTRERIIGLIVVAYAGYFAELRIDDRACLNPTDREFVIKYSTKVCLSEEGAYRFCGILTFLANGIFYTPKYWYAVKILAEKLLEKSCIPGEEAELIIENAIKEYMSREDV